MIRHLFLVSLLAFQATSAVLPHQHLLYDEAHTTVNKPKTVDLIEELKKASIIPDILTPFVPKLAITISWTNASAEIGNTISPSNAQSKPSVALLAPDAHHRSRISRPLKSGTQLTLALTDPDAPSRDDPEWSQICHWVITGVPLKPLFSASHPLSEDWEDLFEDMREIMPYKPPGPPPRTGRHRYVFVALAPRNGTTDTLHLTTPADRKHWGFEGERAGVAEWAKENGLEVVGANFVYAQNDEQ